MAIARLANHRNPHIAILSLALLDTLVQSCGYPFHLQISTKEFLNELVRRFPERPPPFPGPVMSRILELIGGWKEGICSESRWKEDLGNIRDMHRLLTFKGYRFRDVGRSSGNTAANATANLKTAEELEEEDRAAQSAKLQELIRRGTPRDLAAAQEIMKSLAGANPDAKPDYRTQSLTELNKLEQKVILLNEMLDNVDREKGEKFASGDAYDQVSSILTAARPKLQKWISDAQNDDPESLDTFLQINDQINTVLSRYEAFKKGDFSFAANPIPAELASGSSSSAGGLSLIDFDDPAPANGSATTASAPANDLSGLFSPPGQSFGGFGGQVPIPAMAIQPQVPMGMQPTFNPLFQGQQGFGGQAQTLTHAPTPTFPGNGVGSVGAYGMGVGGIGTTTTPPASIMLPGSQPGSQRSTPALAGVGGVGAPGLFGKPAAPAMTMGVQPFGAFGGTPSPPQPQVYGMGGQMGMGGVYGQPQQQVPPQPTPQQQQQPAAAQGQAQAQKDPFADLAGLF